MRILIIDRDREEIQGIEWYLKNYVTSTMTIHYALNCQQLDEELIQFQPHVVLIETELVTATIEQQLRAANIPIIAMTAEPTFQQAMKAISLQAMQLFVKPIPLEQLKSTLLTLPANEPTLEKFQVADTQPAALYLQLFLSTEHRHNEQFFVMEPADYTKNLELYQWLIASPIFEKLTALPLQNRIFGLVPATTASIKLLRLVMQEWKKTSGEQINIALYDGENASLQAMYRACKHSLAQRFYKGYGHIFMSSESIAVLRLDPLLTPEQQQLWIASLEQGDLKAIKAFLYALTTAPNYYPQEDVRIHLTSVLAQIRRFMLKYHLQHNGKIEMQYRALFHQILEHPILYAIVQDFILFTQTALDCVKKMQRETIADYTELAISMIEAHYKNPELTLQIVARNLNMSANYLSTVFSKKRGIPFKKYLQQYRVQQAATLLLETEYSVATIAETVGFVDSNYFTKVFRDYYHITPYRYRCTERSTKES